MNNPWMKELAAEIARKPLADHKSDDRRISHLYESLLGRVPEQAALASAGKLLEAARERAEPGQRPEAGWESLCHAMLMSSEFLYVR